MKTSNRFTTLEDIFDMDDTYLDDDFYPEDDLFEDGFDPDEERFDDDEDDRDLLAGRSDLWN